MSLISQYDICALSEYAPPRPSSDDPFVTYQGPKFIDVTKSIVSVYVPRYPGSQFWLRYSIQPPHPPKALYYFKMYVNGKEFVSWGCGENEEYKGKTMWGHYDTGIEWMGERTIERRVLCFSGDDVALQHGEAPDDSKYALEIRVYRAKGRKQIVPQVDRLTDGGLRKEGVSLSSGGFLMDEDPQTYYKYALLDPLDHPFATFRYFDRSWDQLEALGIDIADVDTPLKTYYDEPSTLSVASEASEASEVSTSGRKQNAVRELVRSTSSPDEYADLTRRSPTPGPKGPRNIAKPKAVMSRNSSRHIKRSASMSLFLEAMGQAKKWCDKIEGNPVSRSPAKRNLSADDAIIGVEIGCGNPELEASACDNHGLDLQSDLQSPQQTDPPKEESAREDSDSLQNGNTLRDVHIPDTAPVEEPLTVPPKPWTKLHRILGMAAMPSGRSSSGFGLRWKGSVDSLNEALQRSSRESPCKAKDGSRASSRASSKGTQLSELSTNEGIKKSDSRGRRMKFGKKA